MVGTPSLPKRPQVLAFIAPLARTREPPWSVGHPRGSLLADQVRGIEGEVRAADQDPSRLASSAKSRTVTSGWYGVSS